MRDAGRTADRAGGRAATGRTATGRTAGDRSGSSRGAGPAGPDRSGKVARRRMTSAELATWRALVDTTAELRRNLGAQLAQETNLSPADYQVLLALSEARGRRLRSSELAATIDWERSRLSHHLARMERRGLIRRDGCATDNRGAEVWLSDEGASMFRGATAPHMRAIKKHFADALTPQQFEALADILQALRDHLHPEAAQQHAGEGRR